MEEILITVVVPIYNVGKYLNAALESLQTQDLISFEVIMIDDGSTDDSGSIARNFAERDKRFHYYRQKNRGLSASRNEGLRRACGKYVLFFDSDDLLEKGALKYLYELAESQNAELIIFGGYRNYYDASETNIEISENYGNFMNLICSDGAELFDKLRSNKSYFTAVPFQLVKRESLISSDILFCEGILHEDHLYTFQILNSVHKCIAIDCKLYHYRMIKNSITKGQRYRERYIGFATTFTEMIRWVESGKTSGRMTVRALIDDIWTQAVKYIIFVSKKELPMMEIKMFLQETKKYYPYHNAKHFISFFYLLLRAAHYIWRLIKMIREKK